MEKRKPLSDSLNSELEGGRKRRKGGEGEMKRKEGSEGLRGLETAE